MTTPAATGSGPIRVLVVDDQELVRSGFCVILETADGRRRWRRHTPITPTWC
jgi:phage baseplate assembly protein W